MRVSTLRLWTLIWLLGTGTRGRERGTRRQEEAGSEKDVSGRRKASEGKGRAGGANDTKGWTKAE